MRKTRSSTLFGITLVSLAVVLTLPAPDLVEADKEHPALPVGLDDD